MLFNERLINHLLKLIYLHKQLLQYIYNEIKLRKFANQNNLQIISVFKFSVTSFNIYI